MKIIDPHLHLFNLDEGEYNWLKEGNAPHWPNKKMIAKSVDETALKLQSPLSLASFIHIEAGFDNFSPWREIKWLEQSCFKPFKSIAYTDLSSINARETIQKLANCASVAGIRHILDEDAVKLLSKSIFQKNLAMLAELGLKFEAQFNVSNVKAVSLLVSIAKQLPYLKITINHAGFPFDGDKSQWQAGLKQLAHCKNIAIKCSGLEMMTCEFTQQNLKNVVTQLVDIFGEDKVMLASNFPVVTMNISYQKYWQCCFDMLHDEKLRHKLMYENASIWYGVK